MGLTISALTVVGLGVLAALATNSAPRVPLDDYPRWLEEIAEGDSALREKGARRQAPDVLQVLFVVGVAMVCLAAVLLALALAGGL
jgi:hypothetical protein